MEGSQWILITCLLSESLIFKMMYGSNSWLRLEKFWISYFFSFAPRLLEKSFELKTQDYEKQIWSLKEDIQALKEEKMHLHHQLEEERVTSDGLKGEVAQLRKQAKVEGAFHLQMSSLAPVVFEPHGGSSFTLPQDQTFKSICVKATVKTTLIPSVLPRMNSQVAFDLPIVAFHILKVHFLTLLKLYEYGLWSYSNMFT